LLRKDERPAGKNEQAEHSIADPEQVNKRSRLFRILPELLMEHPR
jgi:hypothetical protein